MKSIQKLFLKLICSGIFLFISVNVIAQSEVILKGELRDKSNNNEPIPMATISVRGSNISTVTDSKGRFTLKLSKFDSGMKILVSAVGFSSAAIALQDKDCWSTVYKNLQLNLCVGKTSNVQADSDRDNVPDDIDKCPNQTGSADNYGCPEASGHQVKKINWNIQGMKTITGKTNNGNDSGTDLNQLLKQELNNTRILPNKSAEKLIIANNPKLKDNPKIRTGEVIDLPQLPQISAKRLTEIEQENKKDLETDEKGQFMFVQLANEFETILSKFPPSVKNPVVLEQLKIIRNYLVLVKGGPYKKLRKMDTDLLNSDLGDFNNHYWLAKGRKIDSVFTSEIYQLVSTILKPYIIKELRPEKSKVKNSGINSGPIADFYNNDYASWEDYDEEDESTEISVNFYVFTPDRKTYVDSFWVYCLSQYYYDKLLAGRITLEDLDRRHKKCPSPASVCSKIIPASFDWVFIAVPKGQRTPAMPPAFFKGTEIQLDTLTASENSYAVIIYLEN
jgi:hypothetical protein